eukprot:CAMPEP_0204333384 /NCGR_PEP_ID=MMETSP0469-20131031/17180_1 /ASSEMBLY_ACC=CAM_ASM_000384 /TAXON_ID=2969 /ORGANISM="Oxyrrhis marina" /LENGTH=43 /DNA_ID= /DNA_START= /DNA_END= /DNA_ORIENTATION=
MSAFSVLTTVPAPLQLHQRMLHLAHRPGEQDLTGCDHAVHNAT